jgi:hypothetical protein
MANNNELLEAYRANRKLTDPKFLKMVNNKALFEVFLMSELPMGFVAGLKTKYFDGEKCEITVPYRFMNKNPFKSTYFAVLAMAAEMSTGMLAVLATHKSKPSVAMLVTHLEADFVKKATSITTFTCTQGKEIIETVERSILTGEAQTFEATSIGTSKSGEVEAKFKITWSFKARLKK